MDFGSKGVFCSSLILPPPPSSSASPSLSMIATTRFTQRRFAASLTLAFITLAASFEVPFPQTKAQIRSSIVQNDGLTASSLPVPVTQTVKLSSGTTAEIISCGPKSTVPNFLESLFGASSGKSSKKPVIAFLHGSFHSSWCWAEYYMPFFVDKGYECVSLSLQGTGGTPGELQLWLLDCYCFVLFFISNPFTLRHVFQQYPKAPKRFK